MSSCKNEVLVDGDKLEKMFKKYRKMELKIQEQEREIKEIKEFNIELGKTNTLLVNNNNNKLTFENKSYKISLKEAIYKLDLANTFKDSYKNKAARLELTKPFKVSLDKYV